MLTAIEESNKGIAMIKIHTSSRVPLDHIKDEDLHLVDVDESSIMCSSNAETTIKFTLFVPEVPRQATDRGPNTSISVVADPDEWPALSVLGRHSLKQLGNKIYDKYRDDIVKTHHKTLTVNDIRNELENLEDPLQGEIVEPTTDVHIGEKDIHRCLFQMMLLYQRLVKPLMEDHNIVCNRALMRK